MKDLQLLNGAWRMRQVGTDLWHDSKVPGSVYSTLLEDGSMPDPFKGENELAAFDLLKNDFEFTRTFAVSEEIKAHSRVLLRCEGLDTLAHVLLNGEEIAYADNMHVTWEWDVSGKLTDGENTLTVRFDSPINAALEIAKTCRGWCSTDAIPGYPQIRKAHCMYGWDWGPRLPDAGIWRDIMLVGADDVLLESARVDQFHEDGKVTLSVLPELKFGDAKQCTCEVTVTAPDGKTYTGTCAADGECRIAIDDPKLWWPAGYGDQPLYTVSVKLLCGGKAQDEWTRRIGLRVLTVSREPNEWGEEFCHICNGQKIFAMGGDYIPEDNLLYRVTPERTRRLLEDARLANFNAVRVWGGGYYPDDFFYDICDELGLLIWQDFMYACAVYELTPEFEKSIRLEAEQNIRRLRSHASLSLLCGNNEMEEFVEAGVHAVFGEHPEYFPGVQERHAADYIKMFEYILPSLCEKLAPQVFYWPSSPSSGGSFAHAQDPTHGDVHYWDVWHGEKPFTEYRKFHFHYVSEFGFQSFPCLSTVKSFCPDDELNIFSRTMERHQRNKSANGKILNYLSQTYRYPSSFEKLLYASQLLQADAIRYGVEHWRRNRGRCMGAIIWQLNDCWPVASWASIDYFGRWKALHYYAKRFFAPVLLSCEEHGEIDQNPHINEFRTEPLKRSAILNVSNETRETVTGDVCWQLCRADGSVVREGRETVTVAPFSAKSLDQLEFGSEHLLDEFLRYCFVADGQVISEGSALFTAPKHFRFADPKLRVKLVGDTVEVSGEAFARSVCVESDDPDLLLDDNYFDVCGNVKCVKVLRGDASKGLRVHSVYDIDR